jgi:Rieske Fe-S protein
MTAELTRRSAARAAGVAVVGAVAGFIVARNSSAYGRPSGTTAANAYGAGTSSGGHRLIALDDVAVGSGRIITDPPVVVVRPSANAVRGFSAICTHQGCTVSSISNGTINCPCHGSRFDLLTGRVVATPATRPLPHIALQVRNGQVYTS